MASKRGLLLVWLFCFSLAEASIEVTDDLGQTLQLPQPAQRIISLSPHLTENLFAVGAGDQLVGAVSFSDYPPAALELPRVGRYDQLDLETLLSLQPDLVVAWHSGNPSAQVRRVEQLGIPVYFSEPRQLSDLSRELRNLARLSGQEAQGFTLADSIDNGINALQPAEISVVPRVFYQIWDQPLMTVGGGHVISEVIQRCGGVNLFAELSSLAPQVSLEAVILKNPDVILSGGMGEANSAWLDAWQAYPQVTAVQHQQLHFIPPSLIQRTTPRLLEGAALICEALAQAAQVQASQVARP